MSAWDELQAMLKEGERVEAIVFGPWGESPRDEPDPPFVPFGRRGIVLEPDEARKYMSGWSFFGDWGIPGGHAAYIWTDKRVFFVGEYDGATSLHSVPRNPQPCRPYMVNGWPTFAELRGAFPDLTRGKTTEEYMREIRDG